MIKGLRSPIILPDLPQLIPLLNFLIWQALNSPVSAVMRCFFSSQSFSNSSWTCKMKDSRESSNSPTNLHLVLPWGSSSLSRCSLLVKQLFYTSLFKRDAKNQLILLKLFLVVLMVFLSILGGENCKFGPNCFWVLGKKFIYLLVLIFLGQRSRR